MLRSDQLQPVRTRAAYWTAIGREETYIKTENQIARMVEFSEVWLGNKRDLAVQFTSTFSVIEQAGFLHNLGKTRVVAHGIERGVNS